MNSYFEQSGFYGHPHQAAAGMMGGTGAHHDQTAAAYRGFPLSLGMSPYANHHLHQSRTSQDSPYDASITAACKQIYEGAYTKDCSKPTSNNGTADTNGYKDVWNSANSGGGGGGTTTGAANTTTASGQTQNSTVPVRPSACTPDSRVGGYIDASGGSPVSRTGSTATGVTGSWNSNQCSIGSAASGQTAASTGLHQSQHTFYPWMAIAG